MTIELDSTLAQAEVLFLSFAQTVADIDRRKAEQQVPNRSESQSLRNRHGTGASAVTNLATIQLSEDLRELLKTETGRS